MKITKRIETLAAKTILKDRNDCLSVEHMKGDIKYTAEVMARIKKAIEKGRIYISVTSVSASEMSRVLEIRWIENNHMCHVPDYIRKAIFGTDKKGRIHGCGMDMCWASHDVACNYLTGKSANSFPRYHML